MKVSGFGFRVSGFGFRVSGFELRVAGLFNVSWRKMVMGLTAVPMMMRIEFAAMASKKFGVKKTSRMNREDIEFCFQIRISKYCLLSPSAVSKQGFSLVPLIYLCRFSSSFHQNGYFVVEHFYEPALYVKIS